MPADSENTWLYQPIKELPFNQAFISTAEKLGYSNLDDMLSVHVGALLKQPGFTYHMMQELVQFLEEKNSAHLLKQH
jgi:hypothetical protein